MTYLLSRPDRVGDVIIATACLEHIRRQQPGARLVFLAREAMRPLLDGHPLLDGFLTLPTAKDEGGDFDSQREALAVQMREWQPDALVHLHGDRLCQLAGRLAQAPRRIGYRSGLLGWRTLTEAFPDRRREGRRHEGEYNFDLLAPLGIAPPADGAEGLRPRVHLAERWRESLREKLTAAGGGDAGNYSVLNPTAYSPTLRWPAAAFAEFARAADGRLGKLALVAESADDPSVVEIRRGLGADFSRRIIDLTGRCNLAELGWLLHGARSLISRNTGTTHLAAAVGCPTVELFGRSEPIYGPVRWRALGEGNAVISGQPGARRWNESKRAYWRRGHAVIPMPEVLAAALRIARCV